METQYWKISDADLAAAYPSAWSLSCIEGHLEEIAKRHHTKVQLRQIQYIGSTEQADGVITDYYIDNAGDYWYDKRYRSSDEMIVPIEIKIFGEGFFQRERDRRRRQIDSKRISETDEVYR